MASLDFEAEREHFIAFYNTNESRLRAAATSFATLAQLLLSDESEFATPVVTFRVKDRDESVSKFKRKYQAQFENTQTPYEIRPSITDLIGLRVVCLYESELQAIAGVLRNHFEVLSQADKVQELDAQESEFGYKAVHLDLRLDTSRSALPEYKRFVDLRFEVQIRTAIQDAWSTLDHKIKYKKSIPKPLKRRINRLAALFELADQEFLFIRNETRELEAGAKRVTSLSPTIRLEGSGIVSEVGSINSSLLNAAEFIAIGETLARGYPFDPAKADSFVHELLELRPDLTATIFSAFVEQHRTSVEAYRSYQAEHMLVRMNPYTLIRHILYLADKSQFRACLFDRQRATFDEWLAKLDPQS